MKGVEHFMARGGYRPGSGPAKGTKYKKRGEKAAKKREKKGEIPQDIVDDAKAENMLPLEYMLKVMNDVSADVARRDRMAVSAAPYLHSRKGEGMGKKEEKEERVKDVWQGKFSAGRAPLKAVK